MVASDDGGSGEVGIGLAAEGVSWVEPAFGLSFRQVVRIDLPVEVPTVQGPTTTLQSQVSAASVPYDAWSTESDGWEITVLATATDLAGNTASAQVDVPVTRRLWQGGKLSTTGPVSLGAQGQILVNHGSSLDVLLPSGKLESSTAVDLSLIHI